jgi:site-specific DNA-cytosine methylase
MRLLELFCGTKSVSKAVGDQFSEVISLDIEPQFNPTICANILDWDYKVFPPGYFHTIWASPPCQEFSCLNNARPEKTPNLALADALVQRAIEIIDYFNPERFFIENPQTGTLKDRPYMEGIPFVDIDYCQFADWGYRKRTRFWTCVDANDTLCDGRCSQTENGRHRNAIGNSTYKEFWAQRGGRLAQRYSIPPELIKALFRCQVV